jgi:hypothetical protein
MQELQLTSLNKTFSVRETDQKTLCIVKLHIKRNISEGSLLLKVSDEKELGFYSKEITGFSKPDGLEMDINEQFQINNHLSVSVIAEDPNADFEVSVFID